MVNLGLNWSLGNGNSIFFWLDRWFGECSLYCIFPNLFRIATNQQITVSAAFSNSILSLHFQGHLSGILLQEWVQLQNALNSISLHPSVPDTISWRWSSHFRFNVHSFYQWLDYGGIPNTFNQTIWKANIPFKIKIFLWLVKQNKVLTRDNLSRRGCHGDTTCLFCNAPESINHLFVTCPFISTIWSWIASHNGFQFNCTSILDLWSIDKDIHTREPLILEVIRAATIWSIWLVRNKICFNNATIPSIASVATSIISLSSYWCKARNDNSFF